MGATAVKGTLGSLYTKTGPCSLDTSIDPSGTGEGIDTVYGGVPGFNPTAYRGVEGFWDVHAMNLLGLTYDKTISQYHLLKPDGSAPYTAVAHHSRSGQTVLIPAALPDGYYVSVAGSLPADGTITDFLWNESTRFLFIPSATASDIGTGSYVCDSLTSLVATDSVVSIRSFQKSILSTYGAGMFAVSYANLYAYDGYLSHYIECIGG